jgi:tetratricopeptide (TPR) repeat protein
VTQNNSWAEFELGTYLYNHGQREEGEARLQRAVQLDSHDAPALQNLGLVLLDQGKVKAALNLFTQATAEAPKVGLYQNSKGLALVRQGKMDEAQRAFEKAIRLDPELTESYFNKAAVLDEQGNYPAAAPAYAEALRRSPGFPSWAYDRAMKVLHEDDPLYRSTAEGLWRARQADEATAGRYPKIQALLAEAYAANGRMAEAAAVARRALDSTQADADPGFVHGLAAALRRYEGAARQSNAPATP